MQFKLFLNTNTFIDFAVFTVATKMKLQDFFNCWHQTRSWFLSPIGCSFANQSSWICCHWILFKRSFLDGRLVFYMFQMMLNAFVPNAPFLLPLKTSENLTVFWCFQGVEKGCIGNELAKSVLVVWYTLPIYLFFRCIVHI